MKQSEKDIAVSIPRIWKSYWPHMKPVLPLILIVLVMSVGFVTIEYRLQYILRDIVNILTSHTGDYAVTVPAVQVLLFQMLGILVVYGVIRRTSEFISNRFQVSTMKRIADSAFLYLQQHSTGFFADSFAGALVKKSNRYVGAFESLADMVTYFFFPNFTRICVAIFVLFSINYLFGLVFVTWFVAFSGVTYLITRIKTKHDIRCSIAGTKVSGLLADTVSNNVNIKMFSSLADEYKGYQKRTEIFRSTNLKSWDFNVLNNGIQNVFTISMEVGMLFLFLYLWGQGQLSTGDFVLLIGVNGIIVPKMWEFGNRFRRLFTDASYAMEMIEVLEQPHEIVDKKNAKELEVNKGAIDFEGITFSYSSGKKVVRDLDLHIKPGEKVALVGHSGAGKSTMTKLLLRFKDLKKGKVLIDGQDISKVTQDSLRTHVAMIPQEPILFHRTLAENIAYARPDATQAEIEHAAKLAQAHGFISNFPKGYHTFVGERGVKLSGGERQRVAIARAILKDAPILILDEATSSLDSESERLIQKALHELLQGKTAIVIAHRLSTIMEMDRIIVMEDGKIIEEGTHTSLLKKKKSVYKKLWDIQSGGFLME